MKKLIVVLLAAAAALASPPALHAQSAGAAQTFEVASIKPSNPNPTGPIGAAPLVLPALGRLTAMNVTLRMLVMAAYQKQPSQIVGGPPWQNSEKFDINARAEDSAATPDQILALLKTLLADRFRLQVHTETREMPVYALVVARGDGRLGPKLKASTADCPDPKLQQQRLLEAIAKGGPAALAALAPKPGETAPCSVAPLPSAPGSIGMRASGQSLEILTMLLTQFTGRPVQDRTGLTGLFDWDLTVDMQTILQLYAQLGVNVPAPQGLPEGPSLMTTLQEDLGLKLEAQRGSGEVLVIDSAELPTPD